MKEKVATKYQKEHEERERKFKLLHPGKSSFIAEQLLVEACLARLNSL